ncbi:MAG: MetQ/NlpA family ABC transporter substrate-binding protein [Paracholeplasma sp.]|nr:MetQ/NlpA family ABC transporter substrate-binding protein [Paracholeplasma sp.]MDY3195992.1 MetQ/NlpA family ABC transporter substrate-binding protein [Paracholeplasma sp.]
MKKFVLIVLTIVSITLLTGCQKEDPSVIKVGASPLPHAAILEQAKPLLKEKGYTLEIIEFSDYVLPNVALTNNEIIANFFQHEPYLNRYNNENNTSIVKAASIHIEPIGIYSKAYESLTEVKEGDTVLMSNSLSDQGRLLNLLVEAGLITLKQGVKPFDATLDDIDQNLKNLDIKATIAPEMLGLAYQNNEAELILINTNFALNINLSPSKDALILELANQTNPYSNILAVNESDLDDPRVIALIEVLKSLEIQAWIEEEFEGNVVPVIN